MEGSIDEKKTAGEISWHCLFSYVYLITVVERLVSTHLVTCYTVKI